MIHADMNIENNFYARLESAIDRASDGIDSRIKSTSRLSGEEWSRINTDPYELKLRRGDRCQSLRRQPNVPTSRQVPRLALLPIRERFRNVNAAQTIMGRDERRLGTGRDR